MTHTESREETDYYHEERRREADPLAGYGQCKGCECLTDEIELDEGNGLCKSCDQPDRLSDEIEMAVVR